MLWLLFFFFVMENLQSISMAVHAYIRLEIWALFLPHIRCIQICDLNISCSHLLQLCLESTICFDERFIGLIRYMAYKLITIYICANCNRVTHVESHHRSVSPSSSLSPSSLSTFSAAIPSNLSSTSNKSVVTSPLKLIQTQSYGRSIISNNYPNAVNRHVYRWPFIASTTTIQPTLHARKPDSKSQTGTNNVDVGAASISDDMTSTQQAIVDQRVHAHHHHMGIG